MYAESCYISFSLLVPSRNQRKFIFHCWFETWNNDDHDDDNKYINFTTNIWDLLHVRHDAKYFVVIINP